MHAAETSSLVGHQTAMAYIFIDSSLCSFRKSFRHLSMAFSKSYMPSQDHTPNASTKASNKRIKLKAERRAGHNLITASIASPFSFCSTSEFFLCLRKELIVLAPAPTTIFSSSLQHNNSAKPRSPMANKGRLCTSGRSCRSSRRSERNRRRHLCHTSAILTSQSNTHHCPSAGSHTSSEHAHHVHTPFIRWRRRFALGSRSCGRGGFTCGHLSHSQWCGEEQGTQKPRTEHDYHGALLRVRQIAGHARPRQ